MLSRGHGDHVALYYSTDDELAAKVTEYLLGALRHDGAAIVVASSPHRAAIEARLEQSGIHLSAAQASGAYLAIDAEALMSTFMMNQFADPASFYRAISPLVKKAGRKHREVRVYGEMVALLWAAGLPSAAVDVEALWNELAQQYSFSLFCGYPAELLRDGDHATDVAQVLSAHSANLTADDRGEDAMSLLSGQ